MLFPYYGVGIGGVQTCTNAGAPVQQMGPAVSSPLTRLVGIVKKWIDLGGYGFIATSDGTEYFVHCTDVVHCEGSRRRLYIGETVEFDFKQGCNGRPRAINVTLIKGTSVEGSQDRGSVNSVGNGGGFRVSSSRSQPVQVVNHSHLQQQPQQSIPHHPLPQNFPPQHPQFYQQVPANNATPPQFSMPTPMYQPFVGCPQDLQQQYGVYPQSLGVNLATNRQYGEKRSYQRVNVDNGSRSYENSGESSPMRKISEHTGCGQPSKVHAQPRLEIEGSHSLDIRPPSSRLDLNVCSVSIPGDIMIVRGTLNLLGSSTSLGEFYDLLHTHKWYGSEAKDEHRKILEFLKIAPSKFIKLYREFEFFYKGTGQAYPLRLCE